MAHPSPIQSRAARSRAGAARFTQRAGVARFFTTGELSRSLSLSLFLSLKSQTGSLSLSRTQRQGWICFNLTIESLFRCSPFFFLDFSFNSEFKKKIKNKKNKKNKKNHEKQRRFGNSNRFVKEP